ncbi:MAG: hypothetical protein PUC01_06250 [Spirochaetales bacterium]|nr:hypothetical protein [Spirochaetales bacterium]
MRIFIIYKAASLKKKEEAIKTISNTIVKDEEPIWERDDEVKKFLYRLKNDKYYVEKILLISLFYSVMLRF